MCLIYANGRPLYKKGPEFWDFEEFCEAEAKNSPPAGGYKSSHWNRGSLSFLPEANISGANISGADSLWQVSLSPLSIDISLLSPKSPAPKQTQEMAKSRPPAKGWDSSIRFSVLSHSIYRVCGNQIG